MKLNNKIKAKTRFFFSKIPIKNWQWEEKEKEQRDNRVEGEEQHEWKDEIN